MADSFIQLPADSTGKKVDTRTEATNAEHREVHIIGDPSVNEGVAVVTNIDPAGEIYGIVVRDPNTTTIAGAVAALLTNTQLRAAGVEVHQVSGSNWSVSVTNSSIPVTDNAGSLTVDNVTFGVQVQDSQASLITSHQFLTDFRGLDTYVGGAAASTYQELTNPDGRVKVDVNMISGLNETNAGVLRVVQMTDSVSSVNVVTFPAVVVSSITATTTTRLDSADGAYSAANPFPVTLISGALTSSVVVGDTLHDAVDIGAAPVKVGGVAVTTNPTAVSDGDRVNFRADDLGRQLIRNVQVRDLISTAYVTLTSGTETTLLAAGGAGVFLDCISVLCANQSTAAVNIDFRSVTGGNVEFTIEVPAGGPGGITHPVPWPQGNANNNWTVDMPDITGTTVNIAGLFSKEV